MEEQIRQGDIPGVQLRRRVDIPGRSPAEVWPFWVETGKQILWLCDRARADEGPPTIFWLETDDTKGQIRREYAEIFERLEPERLVWGLRELDAGWDAATRVTIELTRSENGCEVMVFQEGFHQLPLSAGLTVWQQSRVRWDRDLARLAGVAGPMAG